MLADATSVVADQCAEVLMPIRHANTRLTNARFVPSLGIHLVSIGRLSDKGIESHFRRSDVKLTLEYDGRVLGCGVRGQKSGLYMLPDPEVLAADISVSC